MLKSSKSGFTLAELLIASLLMSVVVIGIYSIDVTRLRIQNDLRTRTAATGDELSTELVVFNIQKNLETADRVKMLDADADGIWDGILVRTITSLDPITVTYRWDQYSLGGASAGGGRNLLYFQDVALGCSAPVVLTGQITGLTFNFRHEAQDPPPGPVFLTGPEDNNVVSYTLSWGDGTRSHGFAGEATMRLAPYANLGAAAGDSGGGTAGLTAVPATC